MKGKKKRTLVILTMFPFSFVLDVKYAVYILQYYLAFQSLDFECTWWMLFRKSVLRTKFDIYVFITVKSGKN